jgi:hypothetical protein
MAGSHPVAAERLKSLGGETMVAVCIAADPRQPSEHWLVDFGRRAVRFASRDAQETSDWDIIGSVEAWEDVLAGKQNLSVAFRSGAYPFGLGNSPFWPYSGPHPGNSIVTIAAYWAARTQALLEFEAQHAGSSCRVRYEDLTADPVAQASVIYAWLGLDATELAVLHPPHDQGASAVAAASPAGPAALEDSMPPELRATVGRLSERLGYRALPDPAR